MKTRYPVRHRRGKVLFICLGNACRSQMAEAFARAYGADALEPYSAGIAPAARVSRITRQVMSERSIDLDGHSPKSINQYDLNSFDLIINLSYYALPRTRTRVVQCPVRDPMGRGEEFHREVRDRIEWVVKNLVMQYRAASQPSETANNTAADGPWAVPA